MGKYIDWYRQRHETGYGVTGHKHLQVVVDALKGRGVRTVLDWGAGSCSLTKALAAHRPDFKVTPYDPSVPAIATLPSRTFDAVVSTDVLEHIPYEEIDAATAELIALTDKVGFHYIANYPARETFPDGTNIHVIQEPALWWRDQFEANGANVVEARDITIDCVGRVLYRYVALTFLKDPQ
jgi:hypothetical protein